jgi:hypothetical protein|tara:strand:- start:1719 stop:2186 length:468 start_codon:yes stop_codon:yes gene_type:complete
MAHFAELESKTDPTGFTSDTHLIVKRVVVVGNDIEANGGILEDNDCHADGETWCVNFFKGGTWKQTSYNNNFRKQYAGIGYIYNSSKNKFLNPQPYASWSLNDNDDWKAPVTYPTDITDKNISWDESNQKWTATDYSDPVNNFNWDASELTWVSV